MKPSQKLALGFILFFITVAFGALAVIWNISYHGTIVTVGVEAYSDAGLTQLCTDLDAGKVYSNAIKTQHIWIKNSGTVPVQLSMASSSWAPAGIENYLTLSWDQEGTQLAAGANVDATLTLTSGAIPASYTTFSASVTITGVEIE